MRIDGACHCGNVSFAFETRLTPETLAPRACDCEFCTRHGASSASDPQGLVTFEVNDGAALQRYRFGPATADFLVCKRCGVYLGAVIAQGDALRAIVNLRATALHALAPVVVSYQSETREARIARRFARWTPARLRISG